MRTIVVIGCGPWGLCVLERLLSRARAERRSVAIHVIEAGRPGSGVYRTDQPDYLVLNNPCGQLSLYAQPEPDRDPPYGLGLFEWARRRGYGWVGEECRIDRRARPVEPTDFLPRRVMGEYLNWFYETLVADAPPRVAVIHHVTSAVDVVAIGDRELVVLADGSSVAADRVVLTSGHTPNLPAAPGTPEAAWRSPYPVDAYTGLPGPGGTVAVAGMGLVAYDLLAAMTTARGGRFEGDGDRLRYHPSGWEPDVVLYSRSGVPPTAKPRSTADASATYRPVICTPERLGTLRPGSIDFRADVLPLVEAEMQVRYHTAAGAPDAAARLAQAWEAGRFAEEVAVLARRHGAFDPSRFLGQGLDLPVLSSKDYESQVYDLVERDLDEALAGPERSPLKAALETTRILRDPLRSVLEYRALTLESYLDFHGRLRPAVNRVEAGPPLLRSQQLLALLDAGVVRVPLGPDPSVEPLPGGRAVLRSTSLVRPHEETAELLIRGNLELPDVATSASPLLRALHRAGRLGPLCYGEVAVGSIDIDRDFHPIDRRGRPQPTIAVLGVLTEGIRYFTHYLPSPKSRLRAVLDAAHCAEGALP